MKNITPYIILICVILFNIILLNISLTPNNKSIIVKSPIPKSIHIPKIIELSAKITKKEIKKKLETNFIPIISKSKLKKEPKFIYMWVTATAYCPCYRCCGKGSPGITKTGRSAWTPGVAVDPRYIALGSHLDIPGYYRGNNGSWILCDDTGSKIKGKKIDVRFKHHWQAKIWGKRYIRIRVHPK